MIWLPTDHRLGVHHLDARGRIDPDRPMPDIDVVRMALDSAYTLIRDPQSGRRGVLRGLRLPPLASQLTMNLAKNVAIPRELAFRRGDLTWVGEKPTDGHHHAWDVAIQPAPPEEWLDTNWEGVALALTHTFTVARVARTPTDPSDLQRAVWACVYTSKSSNDASIALPAAVMRRGDLTWTLRSLAQSLDECAEDDVAGPQESAGRPAPGIPWWDLGAWWFGRSLPRLK